MLKSGNQHRRKKSCLDLGLDVLDGVRGLWTPLTAEEPEDEVEGAQLLDVVVGEGPAVLKLPAGEDQPLLGRGDALLVLGKRVKN